MNCVLRFISLFHGLCDYKAPLQKEKKALLNEVSVPSDIGQNNTEIKKMTKYQDLKNEVKKSCKLNNAKVVPVIVGALEMMTKKLTEILKTIPGNIITN